ncbi:hypothetical protein JL722_13467 [Aureococcus anophagefferens]|nr:hypothetical protein JL722_13467 [Aureococcus anophagefferens]
MGSMHTGLEEHHDADGGLGRMAAFYGERAAGGAGIIVTGGVAPNREGWVLPMAGKMSTAKEAAQHACVTEAKKAPINVITPRALSDKDIRRTIDDFARCAELAKSCGYDGVEIMGSEGYFINEFLAPRTNVRDDDWGGSFENRSRLALEIMKAVRAAVGVEDFAVIFRVSMLELVENGLSFDESVELSAALHAAGVDIINTGIGWHEARVPTIATCVPRGAFAFATRNVKDALDAKAAHPLLCATNRINDAATAERILARGDADLVSLARPFLADENIVRKAWEGAEAETNTCIGCNQACLDHTFKLVPVSCLVNPRAGHETLLNLEQAPAPQRVAVVGAGPRACRGVGFGRGHAVTLFEASDRVGGQFNLAARVPGKQEFWETLRYFESQLEKHSVDVRLNTKADADALKTFDKVVVATGVKPRELPHLRSSKNVTVHGYVDVLKEGGAALGDRAAASAAAASASTCRNSSRTTRTTSRERGRTGRLLRRVGHRPERRAVERFGSRAEDGGAGAEGAPPPAQKSALGAGLGKTTGWIHRAALRQRGVEFVKGCEYVSVEDDGFHVKVDGERACSTSRPSSRGRPVNDLYDETDVDAFLIGGAQKAGELDAKRAIDQGYRLAGAIETAEPGAVLEMPAGWRLDAHGRGRPRAAAPRRKPSIFYSSGRGSASSSGGEDKVARLCWARLVEAMRRRDVTGAALVREWGKHGDGTLVSYAEFWRGLATVLGPGMAHFSHSERKRLFSCVESNREGMVATRALAKKIEVVEASLALQDAPQPAGKPRALSVRSRARSEDTESVMSTDLSHRNAARELRMRCRRQRLLSADLAFRCALLDQRPLLCCRLYRSRPAAAAPLESLRRPFAQAAAPELGLVKAVHETALAIGGVEVGDVALMWDAGAGNDAVSERFGSAFVAPVHGFSGSILAYAEDAATAEATVFADDGLFWCALEAIAAEVDALACRGSRRLRPLVFSVAVEVQADASGSPRRTPWEAIPVSDEGAADAVARDALARGAASGTLVAARLRLAEIAHARAAAFRAAPFGRPAVESALDVEQLQARKAAYQELQRGAAAESPNIVDSIEEAQAKLEDVEKLGGRLVAWERFSRIQAALGSIQVVCRIRPLIPTDASRGPPPEVAAKLNPARTSAAFVKRAGKGHTVVVDCEGQGLPFKERAFEFDDVWDAKTTQDEVFESIENLADAVLRGCSASVFAYGATGGGKTYTVVGDLDGETPKLGIAFQSVEVLLASLKRDASEDAAPACPCSRTQSTPMHEKTKLSVRLKPDGGGAHAPDVSKVGIGDMAHFLRVFDAATGATTSSTLLNATSSRSHVVVIVEAAGGGRLWLVDLAGSERVAKSGASGEVLKEAACINRSLSALGDVFEAIDKKRSHVPYRNLKLTFLMQDVIGGPGARVLFVFAASPAFATAPETLSSFKFAARMRTIHLDGEHLSEKQKATDAIFAMCGERNERRLLQAYLGELRDAERRALEHCAPETRRALSSSIDEDEVVLGLLNDRPPPLLSDRPPPPAAASPRSLLGDEHSELSVLSRVSSAWATSEREQHLEAELDSLRRRLRETEEALEDRRASSPPEPIAAPAFDDDDEVPAEEDAAADADNGETAAEESDEPPPPPPPPLASPAAAVVDEAGLCPATVKSASLAYKIMMDHQKARPASSSDERDDGSSPSETSRLTPPAASASQPRRGGGDDDDLKVIQLFDPEKQARSPHRRESSKKKRRDRQIAIDFVENEVVGATGCFALACTEEPPSDGESDDGRALGRPRAVDVAPGVPDAADRKVVVSVHRARKIFGGGHAAEYGSVNPYVVCQYGGAESVTAPVRSTLNPVWNKDLTFAFEDGEAPRATLFLFSKNDYLNDSLLGKCVVNFERPEGHGGTERLLARTWLAVVPCEEREREGIEHLCSEFGINMRPQRFLFKKGPWAASDPSTRSPWAAC